MRFARTLWLPWLILAGALGVTWQVSQHEHRLAQAQLQAHFEYTQREVISRIEQRMGAYEQMLRGVQAHYVATGTVDRDALSDYVSTLQLDANFSGVQAIGHLEWVTDDRLDAHLAAMHQLGLQDYHISPAGRRNAYAPIVQREPYIGRNRAMLGFDSWSDPVRRQGMERARDSSMATISGKVRLSVETAQEAPPGFVMYLPIFAHGAPTNNVEQRRSALNGWFLASFRMHDLMASLYGEPPPGISFAIYDGIDTTPANLLYQSEPPQHTTPLNIRSSHEYLVIGGHTWTLTMMALPDFAKHFGHKDAPWIAWSGIGLSLLMALIAWLLTNSQSHAMQLAERMTLELRESERRWAFALEGAGDGVWDWNLRTGEAVTSKRWREIVGASDTDATETIDAWNARIHPEDAPQVMATMQAFLAGSHHSGTTYAAEYRIRYGADQWKWVLARGMVVERDATGNPLRLIGTISDVDERKATETRIQYMAQYDPLTDLPNRALFSDRLQRELAHAQRHAERFALIFLDLDHFKPVNDNYGHAVGDQLLRQVAQRIRQSLRSADTVGRIGGDEFVVLMTRLNNPHDAFLLAEKIREMVREPYLIDGLEMKISCCLGVAIFPEDGTDEITLTKNADAAMYRAKEAGRDHSIMHADLPG